MHFAMATYLIELRAGIPCTGRFHLLDYHVGVSKLFLVKETSHFDNRTSLCLTLD